MSCITSTGSITETVNAPKTGSLWLVGGRVATGAETALRADVEIFNGNIESIKVRPEQGAPVQRTSQSAAVDLNGFLILPGLINAHDHLEFNLFPRLGRGPYVNYKQWAADIYNPNESPLREQLAIPKALRLWWGGLKNLLAGVTTVCHHNPYVAGVFENAFPVRVVKRFRWAHSLGFENSFEPPAAAWEDAPYIIHAAEGRDAQSAEEVFILDSLGLLNSRTVVVHGVAAGPSGLSLLEKRGAALIWCPSSNIFTLGKTLGHDAVNNFHRLALGSDSALTAHGDLLDEIRFARRQSGISPERLYSMVSDTASQVLRLRNGEGSIRSGARADLIALKDTGKSPAETLVEADFGEVELSIQEGEPNLFSEEMRSHWPERFKAGVEPITVAGVRRWVCAPVTRMLAETRIHLGNRIRLAGREVSL